MCRNSEIGLGKESVKTVRTLTSARVAEVLKESLKAPPGWFVGMMCVISFLLFIVVLVCIVKRRRGEQYAVDEKERQRGCDCQPHDSLNGYGEYVRRYTVARHIFRTP